MARCVSQRFPASSHSRNCLEISASSWSMPGYFVGDRSKDRHKEPQRDSRSFRARLSAERSTLQLCVSLKVPKQVLSNSWSWLKSLKQLTIIDNAPEPSSFHQATNAPLLALQTTRQGPMDAGRAGHRLWSLQSVGALVSLYGVCLCVSCYILV